MGKYMFIEKKKLLCIKKKFIYLMYVWSYKLERVNLWFKLW